VCGLRLARSGPGVVRTGSGDAALGVDGDLLEDLLGPGLRGTTSALRRSEIRERRMERARSGCERAGVGGLIHARASL
jgi:hypothetical protein